MRDGPDGRTLGVLFRGQSIRVDRVSAAGRWAYGFAFGHVNRHGWVLASWLGPCATPAPAPGDGPVRPRRSSSRPATTTATTGAAQRRSRPRPIPWLGCGGKFVCISRRRALGTEHHVRSRLFTFPRGAYRRTAGIRVEGDLYWTISRQGRRLQAVDAAGD